MKMTCRSLDGRLLPLSRLSLFEPDELLRKAASFSRLSKPFIRVEASILFSY
jgi:hypothetical protein